MELNGITVDSAGTSAVRGMFLCEDMSRSGYNRVWKNTNNEILLYADNNHTWKFTDLNKETVYYQCTSLDGVPVANPWDRNAGWIIPEGGYGEAPIPLLTVFSNPNIVVEVSDPVEEYDEESNEKIITVITTYTDVSTGSVRKETDVTREKIVYKSQEVERGLQSNLSVGKVYRFSFIGEFKSLGYVPETPSVDITEEGEEEVEKATGIFKLTKVFSYLDLLTAGIDLYENLYNPLGLSKDLFEFDQANIGSGSIYELTDTVDPEKILYMPAAFIDGTPDSSIEEYNRLLLITDLGYFSDVSIVAELQEIIQNVLLCKFGLDSREDSENMNTNPPQVVTGDSTWMHVDDYNKLDAARVEIQGSDEGVQAYNWLTNKLIDNDIYVDFSIVDINKYIGRLIKVTINGQEEWVRITEENKSLYNGHRYLMCVSATTYREINRKLLTQLDAYENIIENGQQVASNG